MSAKMTALALAGLGLLAGCGTFTGGNDELTRRVDYLRQDVENLSKQQEQLTQEIRRLSEKVEGTAPAAQTWAASGAPAAPAAALPTAAKAPLSVETLPDREAKELPSDPATLYQRAFELMQGGKYTEAQASFADFIRRFPQSDLADNAQYWIGECFYAQKNYEEAKAAFQAVSAHFPFGNKVPDALYKESLCEHLLGDEPAAEASRKRLLDYYPDSDAAAKVKK
jgi:tol-pal system protein YbgF